MMASLTYLLKLIKVDTLEVSQKTSVFIVPILVYVLLKRALKLQSLEHWMTPFQTVNHVSWFTDEL